MKTIVRSLASDTNYAALISGPSTSTTKIKYLQLSVPGERQILLILVLGFVPQSSDVYHYEVKVERLILDGDYEEASRVGERSLASSARLTQLRMYALSQQGLLAERIFEYPQYDGARGLLDVRRTSAGIWERFLARA